MKYDYITLHSWAKIGKELGKWRGISVYACAKKDLMIQDMNTLFIVYDDGNALVMGGRKYGYVTLNGTVEELDKPIAYWIEEEKKVASKREVSNEEVEMDNILARIGREVSALLLECVNGEWPLEEAVG